jgi:outer membrane lipoprotein SlyB
MRKNKSLVVIGLLVALLATALTGCAKRGSVDGSIKSIAVFVPGAVAGSPIYEQMPRRRKRLRTRLGSAWP